MGELGVVNSPTCFLFARVVVKWKQGKSKSVGRRWKEGRKGGELWELSILNSYFACLSVSGYSKKTQNS